MKTPRKSSRGRAHRKMPLPSDCKHNTLDNVEILTTFDCRWCEQKTLVSDQYDSHPGICVDCWDEDTRERSKRKGYRRKDYLEERDAELAMQGSLEEFMHDALLYKQDDIFFFLDHWIIVRKDGTPILNGTPEAFTESLRTFISEYEGHLNEEAD